MSDISSAYLFFSRTQVKLMKPLLKAQLNVFMDYKQDLGLIAFVNGIIL